MSSDASTTPVAAKIPATAISGESAPRPWLAQVWGDTVSRFGARMGLIWILFVGSIAILAPLLANSYPILVKIDGRVFSPMARNFTIADVTLFVMGATAVALFFLPRIRFLQKLAILLWTLMVSLLLILSPKIATASPLLTGGTLRGILLAVGLGVPVLGAAALAVYILIKLRTGWLVKLTMLLAAAVFGAVVIRYPVSPPRNQVPSQYREFQRLGSVEWALWAPVPYSPGDLLKDVPFDLEHPFPWAPSREHPMGTNLFNADILSHMIHACRIAMAVGFISTGIAVIIGIIIGGMMGYFVGLADLIGMRLVEIFGAIPTIYLLLTFVAAFPDYRSIYLIMAIIGLTGWVGDARFVRAEFLRLRGQDFVHAAVAAGLPLRNVLFRHLLPNALAPLLVSASFGIAGAIISESTLSFLGLGVPTGDASWGQLLSQAVTAGGGFYWWLALFPGLAIFLTVFAYNLVGEALRDALDPRLTGGR